MLIDVPSAICLLDAIKSIVYNNNRSVFTGRVFALNLDLKLKGKIMADEEENDVEAGGEDDVLEEEVKKKGGLKKLLIILVPLLLAGGGAGAYFTGMLDPYLGVEVEEDEHAEGDEGEHGEEDDHGEKKSKKKKDDHGEKKGKKKKDDHGKKGDGHGEEGGDSAFLAIPPMLVNLNTEDGTPRYLRLSVQLEFEDPADKSSVEAVIPRVVDQFQTYLRELRVRDLRGSAGIYRLQMELLWRVNQAVEPIEVKDVLFQEILIQ